MALVKGDLNAVLCTYACIDWWSTGFGNFLKKLFTNNKMQAKLSHYKRF